jgi:hypothetical protein
LFAESDNYQEVYVRDDDSVGMFLTIRVEEQYTPPATENPTNSGQASSVRLSGPKKAIQH